MKKISFLSLHLGYGGIEKSIAAVANLLCENYDVEIACIYKLYDKPAFELDKRIKIIYLTDVVPNKKEIIEAIKNKKVFSIVKEVINGLKIILTRKKVMVKYLKQCDSNIIIATRDIFDKWLGKYASSASLKIGWEHNHHHNDLKYANKIVKANQNLDYLILVSEELTKYYSKRLKDIKSKCKCIHIPNIVDNVPDHLSKLDNKRFISVGRLSKEKGYIDLLEIYMMLEKKYPDWHLDIIGDGNEYSNLENYILNHNLETKISLHGFQNKDYIDKLLDDSSIYLMTSYTESFGIVLIEAMSHGLPCVAFSSAEGACELIEDGINGYLINNRDKEEYIDKVCKLIENKDLRKQFGCKGYQDSLEYTGEEIVKKWIPVLDER